MSFSLCVGSFPFILFCPPSPLAPAADADGDAIARVDAQPDARTQYCFVTETWVKTFARPNRKLYVSVCVHQSIPHSTSACLYFNFHLLVLLWKDIDDSRHVWIDLGNNVKHQNWELVSSIDWQAFEKKVEYTLSKLKPSLLIIEGHVIFNHK